MPNSKLSLAVIGPGILVAATGVGAGDLGTATLTGANVGVAILWAVIVGAGLKYVLNEGLTRWQLATGTTILEGAIRNLAKPIRWFFFAYLLIWSYLVAMALMSACGVAFQAILPFFENASTGKIVYGILQSCLAVILVRWGGYQLFERFMSICIGVMFLVVVMTAILLRPSLSEALSGMFVPTIPKLNDGGLGWTIALLGGVGGTVTVLCYGYWIREKGRESIEDLSASRLDLAVGYAMTAIFGVAMVIIGSRLDGLDTKGADLVIQVASTLETQLGAAGGIAKWAFLAGAWGAFFSSLLGVWQSVPYLFADFWRLATEKGGEHSHSKIDTDGTLYRVHLYALAAVPISGLFLFDFKTAMKVNGIVGALFIPMLAVTLLTLNGPKKWLGENRNSVATQILLFLTLIFFLYTGGLKLASFF